MVTVGKGDFTVVGRRTIASSGSRCVSITTGLPLERRRNKKKKKKRRAGKGGNRWPDREAACQSSFLPLLSRGVFAIPDEASLPWKPSQQAGGLYSDHERESRPKRGGTLSRNKYASPSKHDESCCRARTSCASRAKRDWAWCCLESSTRLIKRTFIWSFDTCFFGEERERYSVVLGKTRWVNDTIG